jgi:hypothetical protein
VICEQWCNLRFVQYNDGREVTLTDIMFRQAVVAAVVSLMTNDVAAFGRARTAIQSGPVVDAHVDSTEVEPVNLVNPAIAADKPCAGNAFAEYLLLIHVVPQYPLCCGNLIRFPGFHLKNGFDLFTNREKRGKWI